MSPLWRDEVRIYLAPQKLSLVRRARGVRPHVIASTEVAVPAGTSGDAGPVFARLADVLAEPTWQGAVARVVVADHPWARYGIVPWPATRLDAAGRLAHARYVLDDAWGEAIADWSMTVADAPPGEACLACVMPAMLRSTLEATLAPARLKLLSIQPRLVVAFNAFRHRLPPDDVWFVSLDEGSLCAAHVSRGAWDRVHMARLQPDFIVELERLQAFGRLTRPGSAPARMLVDAPAWMRVGVTPCEGMEWLDAEDGDASQGSGLALLHRMRA